LQCVWGGKTSGFSAEQRTILDLHGPAELAIIDWTLSRFGFTNLLRLAARSEHDPDEMIELAR